MPALDVLLWAAGLGADPGTAPPSPARDVVTHAVRHRMVGRLLQRIRAEGPAWAGPELVELLAAEHDKQVRNYEAMHREMRAIEKASTADSPIISLKGPNVFALSGNRYHLRDFGDLDLLPADPHRFTEDMTSLGYHYGKAPSWYEFACLLREGVRLEIHRYVQSPHPRTGVPPGFYEPARHPGIWLQLATGEPGTLAFDDCVEHCVRSAPAGFEKIVVPGPTLGMLVFVAHAYQDYQEYYQYGGRGRPLVRLGELAEAIELATAPGFDPAAFAHLVHAGRAGRAVAWFAWVAGDMLGAPLPDAVREAAERSSFGTRTAPTKIAAGVLADLEFTVDDLFQRRQPLERTGAILGTSRLHLADGDVVSTRLSTEPEHTALTRIIAADLPNTRASHATFNVRRYENLLFLKVHLAAGTRCDRARFGVQAGETYVESVVFPPPDPSRDPEGADSGDITTSLCVPAPDGPAGREVTVFVNVHGEYVSSNAMSFAFLAPLTIVLD